MSEDARPAWNRKLRFHRLDEVRQACRDGRAQFHIEVIMISLVAREC